MRLKLRTKKIEKLLEKIRAEIDESGITRAETLAVLSMIHEELIRSYHKDWHNETNKK